MFDEIKRELRRLEQPAFRFEVRFCAPESGLN